MERMPAEGITISGEGTEGASHGTQRVSDMGCREISVNRSGHRQG